MEAQPGKLDVALPHPVMLLSRLTLPSPGCSCRLMALISFPHHSSLSAPQKRLKRPACRPLHCASPLATSRDGRVVPSSPQGSASEDEAACRRSGPMPPRSRSGRSAPPLDKHNASNVDQSRPVTSLHAASESRAYDDYPSLPQTHPRHGHARPGCPMHIAPPRRQLVTHRHTDPPHACPPPANTPGEHFTWSNSPEQWSKSGEAMQRL